MEGQHKGLQDLKTNSALSLNHGRVQKEWVASFLELEKSNFFCKVPRPYLEDKFNLSGIIRDARQLVQILGIVVDHISRARPITRSEEEEARRLYGLAHARYILTEHGLEKMREKYLRRDFGGCPRALCQNMAVLPCGLSDEEASSTAIFCPLCREVYLVVSLFGKIKTRFLDGAFFGTTFPHLFFQSHPDLIPITSFRGYVPKIFGFEIATPEETINAKESDESQ